MDFTYLLKVLYKRKWYIIGITLFAIAATFVFLLFKKRLYESVAQYSTGFTAEKVQLIDGSSAMDIYGAEIKFNNVIETFKSPKVVGMLSYTLLLHDLNNPQEAYKKLSPKDVKSKEYRAVNVDSAKRILTDKLYNLELLSSADSTERNIIELLKLYKYDYLSILKQLIIHRVEGTDYLNVIFRSENPELSAVVVNTLGQQFINYYRGITEQRGEESATNIRQLVNAQQRKVDSLNQLLLKVRVNQGSIDPVAMSTSAMETVKDLESKLAEVKGNYYTYEQRLNYLNQRMNRLRSSTSNSSNDDVLSLINKKQDLVKENIKRGGNDPQLLKQIADINTSIIIQSGNKASAQKMSDSLDILENEISETQANLNSASATIKDYQAKITQYRGLTNVSPGSDVVVNQLESQLRIENDALKTIKEKYNQAEGLLKDNPSVNIKQTLIGQPAVEPEPAKKLFAMSIAGASMFFASSLFFLFLALFDPAIRTPTQFTRLLNQPLLCALPLIHLKNQDLGNIIMEDTNGNKAGHLFKQNLRKLRFDIGNSGKKIFLFSSTKPGEGKSTIMQALAYSFLLSNKKVLLIDTNFSNNDLTKTFNAAPVVENKIITTDHFSDIQKLITPTSYPGLDIIGCEGGNYTPLEVLRQNNILEHLNTIAPHYDYIFLEGAAMNHTSDTWELTKYIDSLVLVFSAQSTIGPSDMDSLNFARSLNKGFLGAVLNKVSPEDIDA